jgi:hypothetical protein
MIDHEGDRQVLNALSGNGSDLSKPHHIVYYFYFKSKTSAQAAGQALEQEGCAIQRIAPSPLSTWWQRIFGGGEWSCIVEKTMIPKEEVVFKITDQFNTIAATHDGEYDGWEAATTK